MQVTVVQHASAGAVFADQRIAVIDEIHVADPASAEEVQPPQRIVPQSHVLARASRVDEMVLAVVGVGPGSVGRQIAVGEFSKLSP